MNDNLILYNQFRAVPENAKKPISGGRLKGMTDISPMWRIKALTEAFGPCGFGWKYTLDKQWCELGAGGEMMAFCNITLYVKHNGEWSDGIPGTGGAAIVAKETKGLYSDDEAFKKALTDALSVACKALGMGADVYWEKDSKYSTYEDQQGQQSQQVATPICCVCGKPINGIKTAERIYTAEEVQQITQGMCYTCYDAKRKG